jgi:hypothetical protein
MSAAVTTDDDGRPEARTADGLLTICAASQEEPLTIW